MSTPGKLNKDDLGLYTSIFLMGIGLGVFSAAIVVAIYEARREFKNKSEKINKLFLCQDCGVNTYDLGEYYMVHNELWLSVNDQSLDGMLCIGCLEKRLGRILVASDFVDCILNNSKVSKPAPEDVKFSRCSERLKSRLLN